MASIPSWVYQLIKLAISIGSPYLLVWIRDKFKTLPTEVIDIINALLKAFADPTVSNQDAKRNAKSKLKACSGVACPSETKSS